MNPVIEYRMAVDEHYAVTAVRRVRELKPGARRQRVTNWLVGPLLVAVGIALLCLGLWWGGVAFTVSGLLILLADPLGDALTRRKFRGPSFRLLEVRVVLGESSCHVTDETSEQQLDWKLLPKARAFEDGLLLFSAEGHARWLPNSALVAGTPSEAEALLREKVADFAVVPWRKRTD